MRKNWFDYLLYGALGFGLIYRLATLVAPQMPLDRFFITEDGYLMLTVSRNLATGLGLSVSAGEIASNGFQPLATLLYALPYWLAGGDKMAGLAGVVLISTLVAALGALAARDFAARALAPIDPSPRWPLLAAALWFTGPLLLRHSMNALETGLYALIVLWTLNFFAARIIAAARVGLRDQIVFGALCGLTFLARNDGALLVVALFAVRFLRTALSGDGLRAAVAEALAPGLVSLALAAPWLAYNLSIFGSIVPISGYAESLGAEFAGNAPLTPAKLFETMYPFLPIPMAWETRAAVQIAALLAVAAGLALFLASPARRGPARLTLLAYGLFALALTAYYSLYFGAPHFLARYFAPFAPLLITAAVGGGVWAAGRLGGAGVTGFRLASAGALALSAALLMRLTLPGVYQHGHFQVVDWVRANVDDATWVGAVQTGTLGYWHDRTINLDGKVNPDALRAKIEDGDVLPYVMASRIDYIADWAGVGAWAGRKRAGFGDAFELIVLDEAANLAVLRRR